jgi:enamine deaminase RidA (YjgF/YER057c/UK114 family)
MSEVLDRLARAGLQLPPYQSLPASHPRIRTLVVDKMLFVSGHGPDVSGTEHIRGKLGPDLTIAEGAEAARRTALNILSSIHHEVGLERVSRIVKVLGMVRSGEGFVDQPDVIDGASEVFIAAFGRERGIHTRSAVGLAELPMGIPVEIEIQALLN